MASPVTEVAPTLDAIVSIRADVPREALSAGLLGTDRSGHGVRIRADGLIATIGYIVHEADAVWIGAADGRTVPGIVVGYDYDTGFALLRPTLPLDGPAISIGTATTLAVGDRVYVAASTDATALLEAELVARREFAGRWEYLLDDALFTAPPHDSWSGAALLDRDGRLCGIGSLVIQGFEINGTQTTVNMFVPIDLLQPVVDEIRTHGRRITPARPWLGVLVHDDADDLVIVGVYRNCPADQAGLKPGDIVIGIDGRPVSALADMFRRIWQIGSAGVDVPISVLRDGERMDLTVRSADRATYQHKGTVQ